MKTFRFAKYIVLTSALGLLGSCDSFLDVNDNPNAVVSAPASNALVASQTALGFLSGSDLHRYSSIIVQQFSGQGGSANQVVQYDRGVITGTDVNNVFRTTIYAAALADMQQLINVNQASSPVYAGIAKIMQGYLYGITVDCFGDIPYTEALKFAANGSPKYDKSEDVYKSLIVLIDAGIDDLKKPSALVPGADDLIYGGNLARWEQFANTLKMRLYVHYYPKFPQEATKGIGDLLTAKAPVMTSIADNFQLRFETVVGKTNPIDQFERSRPNQIFPSATLVSIMNTKVDPRRPSYFTEFGGAGQYTGAASGTGGTGAPSTSFSRMNTYIRGARTGTGLQDYDGSAPIRMVTYAEYQFILAEYYGRTGNLASAKTAFEAGITASMDMAGVAAAARTAYIAARPALTASNYLQQIIEEKYVASLGVVAEPWTDYRRTGFPQLPLPSTSQVSAILRILPYSDADRAANPANTPLRADLTVPSVFWDPGK
ncbi:Starch-binding associating with outer membrane [Hymenobacter daecheongensis DSM 21074]|uniref:Starch-binding associating with outer membrane n=1 Tax=Hymenobacter daecheongensis DSM 21074 TaxID=1121955 RepID=A0A1M6GS04_9BACT|nr:SusD/RagB family nutrient-binding outer membrane lipoprotein [Hymenobacter daecheongensis]SHJ12636.1 Starch-binding associating with outer membrane [Hymenobacter daecheongensis DSM 21074]